MVSRRVASLLGRWAEDLLQGVVFAVLPKPPQAQVIARDCLLIIPRLIGSKSDTGWRMHAYRHSTVHDFGKRYFFLGSPRGKAVALHATHS